MQHVGDISVSSKYYVLLDSMAVAETTCIAMAVAGLVTGLHVCIQH